jgi:HEAT repeat protein
MAVDEAPVEESASSPFMQGESMAPEPGGEPSQVEAKATPHNMPPFLDSTPAPVLNGGLSDEDQAVLDALLDSHKDEMRRAELEKLSTLPPAQAANIAAAILQRLPTETDGWTRAWMVSALAIMKVPGTVGAVTVHLDAAQEECEWVRFWAVIALAKMQPANLKAWLEYVSRDPHILVKAVALRLLIENGDEDAIDSLVDMANNADLHTRWAACKVLRRQSGTKDLREAVEGRFIDALENCLLDKRLVVDVRFQAIWALADLKHKWLDAVKALSRLLEDDIPDWVRRTCVDALAQIGKPQTKEALLIALRDADAEVRVRAAHALKAVLGEAEAVGCIVDCLLYQDQYSSSCLEALRQIGQEVASQVISKNVLHPDPKVAERARKLLIQLGGEDAVRVLQRQREEALKAYSDILKSSDDQIMTQFEGLIKQARLAFSMTMWMHGVIFGLGVIVLSISLYVAMAQGFATFERFVGIGTAAGSLTMLLALFYRGPLKNIGESVSNLLKVNVVFIGYMRQINQIDASFKQLFLSAGGFGTVDMKQTVDQIQDSVKETMEGVKAYLV